MNWQGLPSSRRIEDRSLGDNMLLAWGLPSQSPAYNSRPYAPQITTKPLPPYRPPVPAPQPIGTPPWLRDIPQASPLTAGWNWAGHEYQGPNRPVQPLAGQVNDLYSEALPGGPVRSNPSGADYWTPLY